MRLIFYLTSLVNEDNDLTKADRALGLLLCFISDEAEKVSKK